jgi:hypothetical protein
MSEYESQCEAILSHLRKVKRIDPLDALKHYGCFRLAARIKELREQGHPIETVMVENESGKRFAEYVMG